MKLWNRFHFCKYCCIYCCTICLYYYSAL